MIQERGAELRGMRTVPELRGEQVESILGVLPEPDTVMINIFGLGNEPALQSALNDLARELGFPDGIKFDAYNAPAMVLQGGTKADIIKLIEDRETKQNEADRLLAMPSEEVEAKFPYGPDKISASFASAVWILGDEARIELTRTGVSIKYSGQEPAEVAELRPVLSGILPLKTEIH